MDGFVFLYEMHVTFNGTMLEYIYIAGGRKFGQNAPLLIWVGGGGQAGSNKYCRCNM
jgi:hypothetical protein